MVEQVQVAFSLGGYNYIISGCEENANYVTSGWIVLNGEILPFDGGLKQDTIVAIQTETVKEFFGGALLPYYLDRRAIFGSGDNAVQWGAMKRNNPGFGVLQRIERLERIASPFLNRGGMVLWKQPAILIPAGWQEVTDWRGRLPLGYDPNDPDFNEVGKTGGNKTHTLQRTHLPYVSIPVKGWRGNSYTGNPTAEYINGSGGNNPLYKQNGATDPLGDGTPVDHMNPFRIVIFIEYVGD
jgi:hypothetical protein